MKGSAGIEEIAVGGIQLESIGDDLVVSVEHDGVWYECFREGRYGPMCHTYHANGIAALYERGIGTPDG